MAEYKIVYNPYSNDVMIEKSGNMLPKNNKLCAGVKGKRLQAWFDIYPGWNGFAQELFENNNDKICSIKFVGRKIDFIDLEEYFAIYSKGNDKTEFQISLESCQNDADILMQLEELISNVKDQNLLSKKQIEEIQKKIEALKEEPFAISVLATMSSGKSTLLNALLSTNLLPVGNRATTSNIVEIHDNDGENFEVETYDIDGKIISEKVEANASLIKKINSDPNVYTAKIYGDIPFVKIGKMRLMLRDTPGPNSQKKEHEQITDSIIMDPNNQSTVIYVLDTTKPEEKSDGELLSAIAREMKRGDRLTADRFFFVINKADDWVEGNDNNNQTMEELISDTRLYLKKYGIENPRLFPVTADLALKIRRKAAGEQFNPIAESKFNTKIESFSMSNYTEICFEQFSSSSQLVVQQMEVMLKEAEEINDKHKIALIHSGIVALELSIQEYMEKYAYPIKISDAIKDIVETIDEEKMKNQFNKQIAEDEALLQVVKKQIEELKSKKDERLAKKEEYVKKVNSYSIPSEIESRACQSVVEETTAIIDETRPKLAESKVELSYAKQTCSVFETKVKEIEKRVEKEVNQALEEELYKDAEKALEEFKQYITQIKASLNVEAFDFDKLKKLRSYDFTEMHSDSTKIVDVEYNYRTVYIPHIEKKKFLFIKWEKIVYDKVEEKDGIKASYVDTRKLMQDMLDIQDGISKNIGTLVKNANLELKSYKEYFIKELEKLDEIIDEAVEDIEKATSEEQVAEQKKLDHLQRLSELEKIVESISKIVQ